jgi:hypothetical protein
MISIRFIKKNDDNTVRYVLLTLGITSSWALAGLKLTLNARTARLVNTDAEEGKSSTP